MVTTALWHHGHQAIVANSKGGGWARGEDLDLGRLEQFGRHSKLSAWIPDVLLVIAVVISQVLFSEGSVTYGTVAFFSLERQDTSFAWS